MGSHGIVMISLGIMLQLSFSGGTFFNSPDLVASATEFRCMFCFKTVENHTGEVHGGFPPTQFPPRFFWCKRMLHKKSCRFAEEGFLNVVNIGDIH